MSISPAELRKRAEIAIAEGAELLEWSKGFERDVAFFPLRTETEPSVTHMAEGFFSEIAIAGGNRTAMGCRQRISVEGGYGPSTAGALRDFVFRDFLAQARNEAGRDSLGGFTTLRVPLGETNAGATAAVPDWRALGKDDPWAVLSIELHDFELRLGAIALRPRQIVYVVQHPAFSAEQAQPEPGVLHRVTIAYPFVPYAPLRNPFGFGPGKFGAAIKLFIFSLRAEGGVDVEMLFVAAPRCEKVLDLGGLPDPVFGGLRLLELASAGTFRAQSWRDRLEALMLETHCRVHAKLLGGFVRRWSDDHIADPRSSK